MLKRTNKRTKDNASDNVGKYSIGGVASSNVVTNERMARRSRRTRIGIIATAATVAALGAGIAGFSPLASAEQAPAVSDFNAVQGVLSGGSIDTGVSVPVNAENAVERVSAAHNGIPMVKDTMSRLNYGAYTMNDAIASVIAARSGAVGVADELEEAYGEYLSDGAIEKARELEQGMLSASSVSEFDGLKAQFDDIRESAADAEKKAKEEAERRESTKMTGDRSKGPILTKEAGSIYYDGHKETYYNLDLSNVIRGWEDEFGEYHVDERGFKMLGDYIIVAANLDVHPRGSIVECSAGQAVVLDTGGFAKNNPTQLDVAVAW